jgi:hypothetical protein
VPASERDWYSGNLQEGRAALSVRLASADDLTRVEAILEETEALDIDRDDDNISRGEDALPGAGINEGAGPWVASDEQVIPVVKEELAVGKRATETRRRVRTHIVERPVQEQVQLQDETVVVERRPRSGSVTAAAGDLQEREYEIIERHEKPVVEKRARAGEEVVVKKDVRKRTETVSDKVRETEVEVEGQIVTGGKAKQ